MGCADSKISKGSECDYNEMDMKIQPVLGIQHTRPRAKHSSSSTSSKERSHKNVSERGRKSRTSDCSNSRRSPKLKSNKERSNNRRKGHKTVQRSRYTDNSKKTIYDPKITAKYAVKAMIGKGTFSRVVRVEHRITKQPYAIKMIEAPEGRDVFEAELSVLRRVNHPNVIRLIEVFESNNKVYMVMELATGGNLLDRLEAHGYFTEVDAKRVLHMVLSGVNYLHGLGITHRDLKPDNLLYYHPGSDSKIMITDFGFASTRKPSGNPYMHTVCGTPQYIAPEIVARRPYTCAVDMWAVGVITYILLTGTFPFDAEQDAVIFKLILRGKFSMASQLWKETSPNSKNFVCALLKRDPQHRLLASEALQHPWLQSLSSPKQPMLTKSNSSSLGCATSQWDTRSASSAWSGRSVHSLRSGHHRVQARQLEELHADPEVAAMISRD